MNHPSRQWCTVAQDIRNIMMNQTGGWMGGQIAIWAVLAVLVVVVVVIKSLFRKR
jgi:hypothetical protein